MRKTITNESLKTFLIYAQDAQNWSGYPWVNGGNIIGTKEHRGNLTQLKRAGLIKTAIDDEDGAYIIFTKEGKNLAKKWGINIPDGIFDNPESCKGDCIHIKETIICRSCDGNNLYKSKYDI